MSFAARPALASCAGLTGRSLPVTRDVYMDDVVSAEGVSLAGQPSPASCRSALKRLLADDQGRLEIGRRAPQVAGRDIAPEQAVGTLVTPCKELVKVCSGFVGHG